MVEKYKSKLFYIQFILLITFKILLDFSFSFKLLLIDQFYYYDFNLIKYINGWAWILIIFILICFINKNKVSKFLLSIHYYIGVVPLTCVYSYMSLNVIFFNLCCVMISIIAILLIPRYNKTTRVISKLNFDKLIVFGVIITIFTFFTYVIITNGLPSLIALDLKRVYEIRQNGFIDNKYFGYLYPMITTAAIPFAFAFFWGKRKYFISLLFLAINGTLFLYSGDKSIYFSVALIIFAAIISKANEPDAAAMSLFSFGAITASIMWIFKGIYLPYSLFVRRMLVLPALIKFYHYDFFLHNPKESFVGTLFVSFFGQKGVLYPGLVSDESVNDTIGRLYFNSPGMEANSGFLTEWFDRFGNVGFFIMIITLFIFLVLIDYLKEKTSYSFALIVSIYFIFTLNDMNLIKNLIFGPGLPILIITLFYGNWNLKGECCEKIS